MLLASSVSGLFKWRQFEPEVILLAVGWYLRFSLSYRDVEELLAERGLHADHVTIGKREAQIPTDGQENHFRFKLAPLELQHFQLLNRLATGGPNNQYFQLHHRTLAERKVDTSLGRARLPGSRNSHRDGGGSARRPGARSGVSSEGLVHALD